MASRGSQEALFRGVLTRLRTQNGSHFTKRTRAELLGLAYDARRALWEGTALAVPKKMAREAQRGKGFGKTPSGFPQLWSIELQKRRSLLSALRAARTAAGGWHRLPHLPHAAQQPPLVLVERREELRITRQPSALIG